MLIAKQATPSPLRHLNGTTGSDQGVPAESLRQGFPKTSAPPPALSTLANHCSHNPTGPSLPLQSLALPPEAPKVPEVRNRQGYSQQDTWKIPIKDWFEADPSIGHLIPLKDWKCEWFEGALGQVDGRGVKYHQRRLIAQEFQRCVSIWSFPHSHVDKKVKAP